MMHILYNTKYLASVHIKMNIGTLDIRVIPNIIPRIEDPHFFSTAFQFEAKSVNGKFEEFAVNKKTGENCINVFYMFIIMYIHNYVISYTYIFLTFPFSLLLLNCYSLFTFSF